jgi:HSP20 family protein
MVEEKNDLIVRIDLPGFTKENINLRIVDDILTINAKRDEKQEEEEKRHIGTRYYKQRPLNINRKLVLPFSTSDGEKVVGTAIYEEGAVTLRIPIPKSSYIPIT